MIFRYILHNFYVPAIVFSTISCTIVPSLSVSGPSGWGPTSGAFIFPGQLLMTLAGTGGGAWLGGSVSRWVHLLPIRSHLGSFLPSGGGCLLLRHSRSRLMEARGSGCHRLTPWLGASTNTSSCQQVLCSGSRQLTPKQCRQYHTRVSPSSQSITPTMSDSGQLTAASGGNLMPEATSCM